MWCDPRRKSRFKDTDCKFVKHFQKGVTCEDLARLCVCYAIARTIPGKDPTHEKYRAFVNMLNRGGKTSVTQEDMPRFIEYRVKKMEKHYGRRILSAVTKAFWMVKQHPIIIYDSNACKGFRQFGLPPGNGDYSRYVKSWLQFSGRSDISQKLSAALAWLPESQASRSLAKRSIVAEQVRAWAAEPWFRNRVLDIYLFYAGKSASCRARRTVHTHSVWRLFGIPWHEERVQVGLQIN